MRTRARWRSPRRWLSGLLALCALVLAVTGVAPGAAAGGASGPAAARAAAPVTQQAHTEAGAEDDDVPGWVWIAVGASGGSALTFALGYKHWLTRRARDADPG